jgi:hypothetical protein
MGVAGDREGDLAGLGATPPRGNTGGRHTQPSAFSLAGEPFSFAGGSKGKSVMAKPPRLAYESVNFSPGKEIMMAPEFKPPSGAPRRGEALLFSLVKRRHARRDSTPEIRYTDLP